MNIRNSLKTSLDKSIALLILLALSPVLLMVYTAIYLEDRANPIFKQKRLGKDGGIFSMYKFRTMKPNAPDLRSEDGGTFNAENDPRVTHVGRFLRKTSLDELPQLLNILKGEMSFIGPRPDLPDQIKLYEEEDKKRLEVRPGITGYAQVMGRNSLGFRERFKYDIEYVENYSLLFDLKILIKTVAVVFKRENVNRK